MNSTSPSGDTSARNLSWHVPATLGLTQIVQWGTLFYSFSLLMPAIVRDTGWGSGIVVGAFSAALLAEACTAMVIGLLLDRVGARWIMTAGSVVSALGLWLAGQVETIWEFYAVWILIGATMPAALYQAAFAAVAASSAPNSARRGMTVVSFAGGLASTVFWPATAFLVDSLGWRGACATLAALNLACALPHLLMPGPAAKRMKARGQQRADQSPPRVAFVLLLVAYATMGLASGIVAVHLVPMLSEKGLGASAVILASMVGVAQVLGRIVEFAVGSRASLRTVTAVSLMLLGISFVGLAVGHSVAVLGSALLLFGAANGVLTIMRGALPAQLFSVAIYGSVSGVLSAAHAVARAAGPLALAWSREHAASYSPGMLTVALLCFGSVLLMQSAVPRTGPAGSGALRQGAE
ncbi:MFS transporter [Roseomonas terrae]|jgi:sugar phosphate permease|uniref:MFS transporter n=1 Tax=Neoroseomonas terrae TaxID=424799 RepID=A0ABS5EC46_9PROT|nr:MFS transporter [Neoroseomonas terrae]MBR0648595.1 MFS transporter [Neoroseomonas terrae]